MSGEALFQPRMNGCVPSDKIDAGLKAANVFMRLLLVVHTGQFCFSAAHRSLLI